MKLSEYIKYLQDIVKNHGDLDCVRWIENDDWDSNTQGWYEKYDGNVESRISNFVCTYTDTNGLKKYADINQTGYIDCMPEKVFEAQ